MITYLTIEYFPEGFFPVLPTDDKPNEDWRDQKYHYAKELEIDYPRTE